MIHVTLPDASVRVFETPVTVADVAADIGAGLAKAALAGRIGVGAQARLVDTSYVIAQDTHLCIVTHTAPEALELIRHSTAHLLAYAVKQLHPQAQVTIGPVVENGFYYDFAYARPFTPEDLMAIEQRMMELAAKDECVTRRVMDRDEAVAFFTDMGEHYKAQIIADIPMNEQISLYRAGEFEDLCRGPHVPSTGKLKFFRLMKVAGAYWRGDQSNEQLQRIYGTAWATREDLQQYLRQLEEAQRRDHRKLGRELDLFHIEDHAPGMIFWHPRGWTLWQEVEQYMRRVYRDNGYQEVKGPQLLDSGLWQKTGHWDKYREHMFITESEKRDYALKPMNCPGHILIFKQGKVKSYRDLPLRYGEFGQCHRNEPSGGLHGMMRVRGFTQDDGHIFCTEDQVLAECVAFTTLLQKVYGDFGFTEVIYKVATRPRLRIGEDALWDKAESALMQSLSHSGCVFQTAEGEGAFYGPKIEYTLKDAIGRQWQCGTMQVDFNMAERLDAHYVDAQGAQVRPVMLHRAIVGSLERFIGILLEQHTGALPVWLSPVQVGVAPITDAQTGYAESVQAQLQEAGLRVVSDLRGDKINYKIREFALAKIPYILVVGNAERETGTVSVRLRGAQGVQAMGVAEFIGRAQSDIVQKV